MVQPTEAPFNWIMVIWGLHALGVAYFSFQFVRQLLVIQKFVRQNPPETSSQTGKKVIYTAGQFPTFSFLNYPFWDNTQNLTETETQKIWQHESVHIYQKHTWNILYLTVLEIILWFNPLVYLYKKAQARTHDYIADAVVIRDTNQQDYTTLLVKQVINPGDLSLGHYFSKSLTPKQMKMLQKK